MDDENEDVGTGFLCAWRPVGVAGQEVNVYSNRQDELIKPIIQQFEKEPGIKVNVVFAKRLNERLEREGKLSPADLMLTVDISRLTDLVDKDWCSRWTARSCRRTSPPSIAIRTTAGSR
jgi:iron(III) transport system substrate-binding protein